MQQIARAVTQAFNNLPRPHRVMLGSLSVLTLAVAVWRPYIYHPESAPIVRTIELEKSEIRSLLPEASEPIDQAPQEEEAIPQDELDEKADSDAGGHEYVVSTGDTLSSILNQYGIDMGDIAQLSSADKELRNLKDWPAALLDPDRRRRSAEPDLGDVPPRDPHLYPCG